MVVRWTELSAPAARYRELARTIATETNLLLSRHYGAAPPLDLRLEVCRNRPWSTEFVETEVSANPTQQELGQAYRLGASIARHSGLQDAGASRSRYVESAAAALGIRLGIHPEIRDPHGLADAMARAVGSTASSQVLHDARWVAVPTRFFDIWHEVPLVPQTTSMNCWAAAAAMVIGWRDRSSLQSAHIRGGWLGPDSHRAGLEPKDVLALATSCGLVAQPPRTYGLEELRGLLERHGPLWAGQADPDLHVVVITGLYGDGTPDGTWARINDPWPIGRGERYAVSFRELSERFRAATQLVGLHAQLLHAGARRCSFGHGVPERSGSPVHAPDPLSGFPPRG